MNRIPTDRPKIIITASPHGVETVSIRVRTGERDMGLLFLRQVLPAIRTVNLRAQFEPKGAVRARRQSADLDAGTGRPSSELLTWRKREMDTMDKIPMVDVTTQDVDEQEARWEMEQNEEPAERARPPLEPEVEPQAGVLRRGRKRGRSRRAACQSKVLPKRSGKLGHKKNAPPRGARSKNRGR